MKHTKFKKKSGRIRKERGTDKKNLILRMRKRAKERQMFMQIVWHDAGNAVAVAEHRCAFALKEAKPKSESERLINSISRSVRRSKEKNQEIRKIIHSRTPLFWKSFACKHRAREAIKLSRQTCSEIHRIQSNPAIRNNKGILKELDTAEEAMQSFTARLMSLYSRRARETIYGILERIQINDFIGQFLKHRGTIYDKAGFKVEVELVGGKNIPAFDIEPEDAVRIFENLLTDATTHPFLGRDASGEETARVRISTGLNKEGNVEINLLSIGGQPIPDHVIKNLGIKQYSITGKSSRGVGKISVMKLAKKYGGLLFGRNTPEGPLLTVTLKPFLVPA